MSGGRIMSPSRVASGLPPDEDHYSCQPQGLLEHVRLSSFRHPTLAQWVRATETGHQPGGGLAQPPPVPPGSHCRLPGPGTALAVLDGVAPCARTWWSMSAPRCGTLQATVAAPRCRARQQGQRCVPGVHALVLSAAAF